MFKPRMFRPFTTNLKPPSRQPKRQLFEIGDGPPPTQKQLEHFRKNRKPIIESLLVPQLKKSKDIMHGATSRNIIIQKKIGKEQAQKQNLITPTYDYDVWSAMPKKRAVEIENKIDKQYNADVAQVEKLPIGKRAPDVAGQPTKKHERYAVVTPATPTGKQEVDYTSFPARPYKTNTIDGVRHETLASSYKRAQEDKNIPLRTERASREIQSTGRLDRLLRARGKKGVIE